MGLNLSSEQPAPNPDSLEPGEYSEQAAANANPNSWEWQAINWELATENWQAFSTRWYGAPAAQSSSLSLESLAPDLGIIPTSILVRERYVKLFKRVWKRAMSSKGDNGAIVTGQSGTGKRLFQFYLLVQLLQRKQLVLFTMDGYRLYLFYHDKVYTITMTMLLASEPRLQLPKRKSLSSKVFIWSLLDIEKQEEPNRVLVSKPCLPVQTASPDPCRFYRWEKQLTPLHVGMPLWTREELVQGLVYQDKYVDFFDALRGVCESPSQYEMDPLEAFPGARALFKQLKEHTPSPSPQDAVDYILDAAIYRFGASAGDVFRAVFNFASTTKRHQTTFSINYEDLRSAIFAHLSYATPNFQISDQVLALSPVVSDSYTNDDWRVNFKSNWVAKSIIKALDVSDDDLETLISQIEPLWIPHAEELLLWFIEPVAHRIISESAGDDWPLISMTSDGADSPSFVLAQDIPVRVGVRFTKVKREVIHFESISDMPTSLDNNKYYVPESPDFPLFHAFVVDVDHSAMSAILWIIRIATSQTHGGCTVKGYQNIRSIVANLKKQLGDMGTAQGDSHPSVEVRHLAVVCKPDNPDPDNELEWDFEFPKGWSENCEKNDHRGEVYCIKY